MNRKHIKLLSFTLGGGVVGGLAVLLIFVHERSVGRNINNIEIAAVILGAIVAGAIFYYHYYGEIFKSDEKHNT